MARLVDKPSLINASCRGNDSDAKARRNVATASQHTASARSKSGATCLIFSNFFRRPFDTFSASSASSVPKSPIAPARVRTSLFNTRDNSLHNAASSVIIASNASFALSRRAKAIL
eukprot:CAMPEP_0204088408 /NCGR_PEP_ID=MMETSP0360-20130528/186141_1 /ASSEMBLY_ACC=CAM_ASM_000342 /TAXON_ID=268821 /ORGANISM="Scrippsiella Hangoei, Strain SHTV-5" /LENGTH=115 /DNA_ID=CAMNT_0051037587 /DNA_START=404 /DNA_END=751 /DNA_ORIENTATION=+